MEEAHRKYLETMKADRLARKLASVALILESNHRIPPEAMAVVVDLCAQDKPRPSPSPRKLRRPRIALATDAGYIQHLKNPNLVTRIIRRLLLVEMHETAQPFVCFELGGGGFYKFIVPLFGISTAPRIFSLVMSHCVRFLRDDSTFAHATGRGAIQMAQLIIQILKWFGWLIHPTKCVDTTEAFQTFVTLGTQVNLAAQTFSVTDR